MQPLAGLSGTFTGTGLNLIFRPQNRATPTSLPIPVPDSTNILELNLTSETLTFDTDIGTICNRGSVQGDITLNGVDYLQKINDVTDPANTTAIHYEPGVWLTVPATTVPDQGPTVVRLGSIPHGVTVNAQGTFTVADGAPTIPPMNTSDSVTPSGVRPFLAGSGPPKFVDTPSLTAAAQGTARIPQDLTKFISSGNITQEILNDPNTLLRAAIAGQHITSTTTITVSTSWAGGIGDIAFLSENAQVLRMRATFYIETVSSHFSFFNRTYTQIQYSQEVLLNYAGVTFPHITVATLTS